MSAIKIENCDHVVTSGITINGFDVGIEVSRAKTYDGRKIRTRNTKQPISLSDVRRVVVKNISLELDAVTRSSIVKEIEGGATLDSIASRYGIELRGGELDVDKLMSRLGNAASVLSFIYSALGGGR